MYKILSGKYDTAVIPRVNRQHSSITRGNDLRLVQKTRVTYDLRNYYFTNRALNIWNSLPNHVTMLFCLIQLIRLYLGLINSGIIKMLFMISKPKFVEPEIGVLIIIRY